MFFQKVLKGISGLSRLEADDIVLNNGIYSNWWRNKKVITNTEVKDELTEGSLLHHLNDYDQLLPVGHKWSAYGSTYGDVSAFISTTAGTVQRDAYRRTNVIFPPFVTALQFATNGFKTTGYIFYAYIMTLGKQSVALQGFSEEVRELHIYTDYLPFHHEGEVTAKISIPSVNIEMAECYDGPQALKDLKESSKPNVLHTIMNPDYVSPNNYTNIRELF